MKKLLLNGIKYNYISIPKFSIVDGLTYSQCHSVQRALTGKELFTYIREDTLRRRTKLAILESQILGYYKYSTKKKNIKRKATAKIFTNDYRQDLLFAITPRLFTTLSFIAMEEKTTYEIKKYFNWSYGGMQFVFDSLKKLGLIYLNSLSYEAKAQEDIKQYFMEITPHQ